MRKLAAPAERRRQNARDSLQETSELAALIARSDDGTEPTTHCEVISSSTEDFFQITTQEQLDCLAKLISLIGGSISNNVFDQKNDSETSATNNNLRSGIMTLLEKDPYIPCYLIPTEVLNDMISRYYMDADDENKNIDAIDPADIHPTSPLCIHLAAILGNTVAWQCLLEHHSRQQVSSSSSSSSSATGAGATTNEMATQKVMKQGNLQGGHSPLHLAVIYENLELVRMICATTPLSCRILDSSENLALHLAVGLESPLGAASFRNARRNVPAINIGASTTPDSDRNSMAPFIASTLLATYPNAAAIRNACNLSPLHIAAQFGALSSVRLLLAVSWMLVDDFYRPNEFHCPPEMKKGKQQQQQQQEQLQEQQQQRNAGEKPQQKQKQQTSYLPVDLVVQLHRRVDTELSRRGKRSKDNSPITKSKTKKKRKSPVTSIQKQLKTISLSSSTNQVTDTQNVDDEASKIVDSFFSKSELSGKELSFMKMSCEECIEALLLSAFYKRAVLLPRDEIHPEDSDAPFFLPLHATFVRKLQQSSWRHLLQMYGNRHATDVDRHCRNLLHVLAESSSSKDKKTNDHDAGAKDTDCKNSSSANTDDKTDDDSTVVDMISQIHKLHPKAHSQMDSYGMIPLQLAVVSGAHPSVIEALVQCGSETVEAKWREQPTCNYRAGEEVEDHADHSNEPLSLVVSRDRD